MKMIVYNNFCAILYRIMKEKHIGGMRCISCKKGERNMYRFLKKYVYLLSSCIILVLFIAISALILLPINESHSVFSDSAQEGKLTFVIDPGHGGEDGGAVSVNGICESSINLEISLKMEQLFAFLGANTVMTRSTDTIDYPSDAISTREKKVADQKRRVALVNETENAVLISIHQNNFSDSKPFGAQVFFSATDGSEELAVSLQQLLIESIDQNNYRIATQIPDSIYLMNKISCPAVLVECGFLSNYSEAALLTEDAYQLKLATVLTSGCIQSYEALESIYYGGTNESEDSILLYRMWQ
jgi:N-acetylmuramoyl-L-alanine amidase